MPPSAEIRSLREFRFALLLAAALISLPAAVAAASEVPVSLRPHQARRIELLPGGAVEAVFEAVAGTSLSLVVRARGVADPVATLFGPAGEALLVDAPEGRLARGLPLSASGTYRLVLGDPLALGGCATVRLGLRLPRTLVLPLTEDPVTVPLLSPGSPGALTALMRVPEGVQVDVLAITAPDGQTNVPSEQVTSIRGGRVLRVGPLTTDRPGLVMLEISAVVGAPPLPADPPELVVSPRVRFSRSFRAR